MREEAGEVSDACSDLDEEENGGVRKNASSPENGKDDSSSEEEGEDDEEEEEVRDIRMTGKKGRTNRIADSDDEYDNRAESGKTVDSEPSGKEPSGVVLDENSSCPSLRLEVTDTMMGVDSESSGLPPSSQNYYKPTLTTNVDDPRALLPASANKLPNDGSYELPALGLRDGGSEGDIANGLEFPGEGAIKKVSDEGEKKKRLRLASMDSETDGDSVGEMSFQWGQSLPPAQQPKLLQQDTLGTQTDSMGEESQWQATPMDNTQRMVGDETQILDEEG